MQPCRLESGFTREVPSRQLLFSSQPVNQCLFTTGSNTYVRPDAFKGDDDGEGGDAGGVNEEDELRKLRFSYRLTAFDTDLDEATDQPWRKPRTDISDFFNYGLTEATWKV